MPYKFNPFTGNLDDGGAAGTFAAAGAGTAALPSISFAADNNTGLFNPAADTLAFATNGVERLRVNPSGDISISNSIAISSTLSVQNITMGRGGGAVTSNTANGYQALYSNTTGNYNTANGYQALSFNTIGNYNTANGYQALYSNTTGSSNTANGYQALYSNTTGSSNTANGISALYSNTTGSSNTANGYQALSSNATGNYNTANGINALYSNTTGTYNTANGLSALHSNTTGSSNIANGINALYSNTTGSSNTANGYETLSSNTIGNYNTAIGRQAGYGNGTQANTTGSNNTFIGFDAMGASATASNVMTLGNGSIATLRCQVQAITALSDARDKTNITNIPAGLGFINALRPVAFDWNTRDGKKVGIPEFGFIAQELQDAQALTGVIVPNLVSAENPDKLEASPGTLLPVLVNAVQELTVMVRDLQAELFILKEA